MANLKYKHTAYTSAQWASLNPVIVENEIVIESDTKRTKIGNGISTYNQLEYSDANSIGNSLGSIKPTDAAPTPARNGNYTFSIGGNKPAWLTAEAGVTTVKAGDGVAVVYTAPSGYTYTHVNIDSSLKLTDYSKFVFTKNSTLNSFFKELYIDKTNYALPTTFESLYCTLIRRNYETSPNYAIVLKLNSSAGAEVCTIYSTTYDESTSIVPLTHATSGLVGYAVVDWNAIPVGATSFNEKIAEIAYNVKFSPYIKNYLTNIELNSSINSIQSIANNNSAKIDYQISNQIEQTKEYANYLLNSGEVGFPEAVFEVDANRVVSVISTPSDAPFDINVLPTIRRFAYILPSNEKKIFLNILQGAPRITLSFWTKASQLAACGCTKVRVYGTVGAAVAWRYITLPTTVGSVMKNNQDEEMRLEMTAKYDDWVCLRFQWDNTKFSGVFQFTFDVTIAGELYFANMFLSKSIIDIDPLTVRYKLRNSTLPVLVSQFYPLLNSSKNFLYGNEFFSLCDSLGTGGIWQNKLAQLAGATFDNAKNIDVAKPLSIGGTATISNQKSCGQWRARNLVANYPTAKTLFIMNINDVTITSGLITDQPFMLSRVDNYADQGLADLIAANNYWTENFATIVAGYTPIKGAVINIPYYGTGKNLKITGLPTSNGNVSIIVAGKTYSIAVTTADTIQTLLVKILEYQYELVSDAANADGLSVDFYYPTGVNVTFNANGTGMTTLITDTTTAQVFAPRYFMGEANSTDWNNPAKWSSSTPSMNAAMRGLIEYLQKNMPLCEIIWVIPNRYGVTLANYLRADGTPDIDAFNASDTGYQTLCSRQKAVCDLYNIRYVDLNKKSGITLYNLLTYYNENNVHPKTAGYEKWGEMIYKMLIG